MMREVEVDIMAYLLKLVSADGGLAAALLSHPRLPALLDHVAGTRVSDAKVRGAGGLRAGGHLAGGGRDPKAGRTGWRAACSRDQLEKLRNSHRKHGFLPPPGLQMGALLGQLSAAFHAMLSAAAAVGAATGEAPGGGAARAPPACLAQLSAAADGLEAAMRAAACPTPPAAGNNPFALPTWVAAHGGLLSGPGGLGMGPPPSATAPSGPPPRETFAAFRATLVPLAAQLATALLPHWPPPEVQRAERLELARAVAACRPGCSNLCCPDWREQCRRPHKCAGCMVSRFCGVACQKAAWGRGGHKSVCKLLGAPAPADE